MRNALPLLLLLLPLHIFGQTTLAVHTSADVGSGAVTTSAIDTTGATLLVIETYSIFGPGAVSDSKGNIWTDSAQVGAHNTGAHVFSCNLPCTVGSGHTFTQAANGSGYPEGIIVLAFTGGRQLSSDWRDVNILTANRTFLNVTSDPPPNTIATAAWENTTAGVIALTVCVTEQGTGGTSTVDSSFAVSDHITGLTSAWKFIPAPSTTFDPTWTTPSDALHQGVLLQGFLGSVGSTYVPNFA